MENKIWESFDYRKMVRDLEREITSLEARIAKLRMEGCEEINAGARLYLLEDELCELHITRKHLLKKARRREMGISPEPGRWERRRIL